MWIVFFPQNKEAVACYATSAEIQFAIARDIELRSEMKVKVR